MRPFGSKRTVLKKVLVTLLELFGNPRSDSVPRDMCPPCPHSLPPSKNSILAKLLTSKILSPPVIWGLLWSHFVVEITWKFTLRRKSLGEIPFCQLASISQCAFTISSTPKATMKPMLYFMHRNGKIFGIGSVSAFQNFGENWSYYYWRFQRPFLLTKVSAKYCTRVTNTAIVLTWTRSAETPQDFSWPTCKLHWKTCR